MTVIQTTRDVAQGSAAAVAVIDNDEDLPLSVLPGAAATPATEIRGPALRRALGLGTIAWLFGSVWLTAISGTPFTNFAKALNASEFQFGLLAALPFIASLLSIPASLLIEATGARKKVFLWGLYFQRLMWVPIAVFPVWLMHWYGASGARAAMFLFLVLVFLMHAGNAVGGPAWVSWVADLVPDRVRGRYFSRRRQWGILTALPTALLVGWMLDRYAGTGSVMTTLIWCGAIFIASSFFGVMDIVLFQYVPDIPKAPQAGRDLLKAWREPLSNPQFLWFAAFVGTLMFSVSFIGQFVTLHIMRQLGGDGGTNTLTQLMVIVAPAIAQLFVLPVWGRAADRVGKRPVLIIAGLGMVPVGIGWCFVTRDTIWLGYLLSAAGAALWTGVEIGNFNLVLEMSGSGDEAKGGGRGGSSYVAVNSVIVNIAGCLGGLTAGAIAQWLKDWDGWHTTLKVFGSYDVLFALSAVLRLVAVVAFLPRIKEPTAKGTREALRFMMANIYNNLFNAVLQPLRFLRIPGKGSYASRKG